MYREIKRKESLLKEEILRIRQFSDKELKATLPGPYLMTRSMWLPALSSKVYDSKEELGKDVVALLKEEIEELRQMGGIGDSAGRAGAYRGGL